MFFHNKIIVHPLPDGNNWITEDWIALSLGTKCVFVPRGFKTDFGSIASFLWAIVGAPATGKHRRGVLFHDWIYSTQQISRKEADDICLDIMKFDKTNFMQRHMIYYGVRVGGFVAWNRKTKKSKLEYIITQKEQFSINFLSDTHSILA